MDAVKNEEYDDPKQQEIKKKKKFRQRRKTNTVIVSGKNIELPRELTQPSSLTKVSSQVTLQTTKTKASHIKSSPRLEIS